MNKNGQPAFSLAEISEKACNLCMGMPVCEGEQQLAPFSCFGSWHSEQNCELKTKSKYPVPLACAEVLHVLNAGTTPEGENLLPLPGQIRLMQLVFCSCSGFECSELNCELRITGKYTVLLACTEAFHVLDANGNPKQMRLRNTQTVRHFMHLRVIQMHACESEIRVNYAKSVNQNSSTACTETKALVVRLKYWILILRKISDEHERVTALRWISC